MKKLIFIIFFSTMPQAFALSVEQGKKMLVPFKKELMGTLMAKMKEAGPVAALKTCKLKAMPITNKYASEVVAMGRTSHKLRNPDNIAVKWVKPYIEEFKSGQRKEAMVVKLENGHTGFLEPIYIQGKCLTCHGSKLSLKVKNALSSEYPKDQATGFKVGDFRGLFWMETSK